MFPVPSRLFWLSVLVALDGSVGTPAHSSKVKAKGQDGHGTRGQADAHERRSDQTSRNRHAIQNHLIHRRNPFSFAFFRHQQSYTSKHPIYIYKHRQHKPNTTAAARRHAKQQARPADAIQPTPPAARTTGTRGQTSSNEPPCSPPTLVARRGDKTNEGDEA